MFLDVSINFNHCVFGLNLNVKQASFSFPTLKKKIRIKCLSIWLDSAIIYWAFCNLSFFYPEETKAKVCTLSVSSYHFFHYQILSVRSVLIKYNNTVPIIHTKLFVFGKCHGTPFRGAMNRATFMLSREPYLNVLMSTHVLHMELLDEGAGSCVWKIFPGTWIWLHWYADPHQWWQMYVMLHALYNIKGL